MRELHPHKVRELSVDEVRLKVRDLREELFNLRFRNSMRQLDNPLKIREARRDLARLQTILKEHEKGIRPLGVVRVAAADTETATAAEAAPAKRTAAKKTTAKKATAKKTAVKKTTAKKAVAKSGAKKTAAGKSTSASAKGKAKPTAKTASKSKTAKGK